MTVHNSRNYLIIIVLLSMLGGIFYGVRQCRGRQSTGDFLISREDSLAVEQFQRDIEADSLRRVEEREARWLAKRQYWDSINRARYEDFKRRHPRQLSDKARAYLADRRRTDSIRATRPQKYDEGTLLDLNTADSLMLIRVPLIASGRAIQILKYRSALGGFISPAQLAEIDGMPEGMERWFVVDPNFHPRTLSINKADFRTLVRHPYLSYDQVCVIFDYRRKYGNLRSWQDLSLSPLFTPTEVKRLTPYISFD